MEQIKHIETNPSISHVLAASDNVSVSLVRPDQTGGKRQSDRQIEEEKAFKGSSGEDKQMDKLSIKDVKFGSLIKKAEIGLRIGRQRRRGTGRRRKKCDDVYDIIIISWSIMVNNCKELLLEPAIITNDTFSSVSAQGRHTVQRTHCHTHMFMFEAV